MNRPAPCKRAELISFIVAYSVATKTEDKLLMGLAGDALNKVLDTLTFADNLEQRLNPVIEANSPPEPEKASSPKPATNTKKSRIKKESEEDF